MSNHRAYNLYAHITWHTWRRVGCVNQSVAADVLAAIAEAGGRCKVRTLRTAVMADHIHLLVSYRPSTRLADFIRLAKAGSAFRANRRSWGSLRWARGYYVASLTKTDLPRVDRYIARQFERHPDLVPRPSPESADGMPVLGPGDSSLDPANPSRPRTHGPRLRDRHQRHVGLGREGRLCDAPGIRRGHHRR
ncbi:MAG: IS200/IS605 family transposase [Gemmatimonadetes bacterium]|nr:IS200/IS605 family transposase [Gemmatimonadota bacterium]